ncbi:MAG: GNAT family N-acetyltransferase [Anaerolineales bacterium]|nr:GNAT family N-acetyltransferase [Anaerolineales bacterium]
MIHPPIHLRQATAKDNRLLAELGARTFGDTFGPDNTPEDMAAYLASAFGPRQQAAELADTGTVFLVADVEGESVGYARMKQGPAPACIIGQRPVEITRLYAIAPWIGRGVGAGLMRGCLARAQQRGCDVVWLDVWERNTRAIAFYRHWGFADVGTQPFVLGTDVQHDLLMARGVEIEGSPAPGVRAGAPAG